MGVVVVVGSILDPTGTGQSTSTQKERSAHQRERGSGNELTVMAEESARVAQRCEAGKESLELLLDGCGLRKFPDAIFFLMKEVELRKVVLAYNQLQKIPAKLGLKFTTVTGNVY